MYIKVSRWMFPDTANFKNNLLTCRNSDINCFMEDYSQCMLLIFHSYRSKKCLEPLQPWLRFPFVMKLRELNATDHLRASNGEMKRKFSKRNLDFLQNIQDCGYNSMRYKLTTDDLQSVITYSMKESERFFWEAFL